MAQDLQLSSSSSEEAIDEQVSLKKLSLVSLQNDKITKETQTNENIGLSFIGDVACSIPNVCSFPLSCQGSVAGPSVRPSLQEVVCRISSQDRPSGKTDSVKNQFQRKLLAECSSEKTNSVNF